MLADEPRIEIVGQASNGVEGLRLARDLKPDVITLDVEMPPPPAPLRIPRYQVAVDAFSLQPRVSCATERRAGIRPAYVTFDSLPRWAPIEALEAHASADVCNPRSGFSLSMRVPAWSLPAAFGLGVLATLLAGVAF